MAGPGGSTTRTKKQQTAYNKLFYARHVTGKAPARGNKCSKCGKEGPTETHHADYNKPLAVSHLCASCNRKAGKGRNA
jgi:hypothetical protein